MEQPFVDDEFGSTPSPLASAAAAAASAIATAAAAAASAASAASASASASPSPPPSPYALVRFVSSVPQLVWVVLVGVAYYLGNLYVNQESVLYHPTVPGLPFRRPAANPPPYHSPAAFGLAFEDVALVARDGVRLHAWFVRAPAGAPAPAPTLVFFHANAGNIGFRLPLAKALVVGLGCNMLMLEYRGYGNSEGVPGEEGIALDAEAAMDWVRARAASGAGAGADAGSDAGGSGSGSGKDAGLDADPSAGAEAVGSGAVDARAVFLFGQSLGGAVAVRCAASRAPHEVAGLILENTFTSISDMVDRLLPFVAPLKPWLLRIKWASVDVIGGIEAPMLFVGGARDELVEPRLMRRLHDAATRAAFRTFFSVPDGTHNDSWLKGGEAWAAEVRTFVERALARRGIVRAAVATAAAPVDARARAPRRAKELLREDFDDAAAAAAAPPVDVLPSAIERLEALRQRRRDAGADARGEQREL